MKPIIENRLSLLPAFFLHWCFALFPLRFVRRRRDTTLTLPRRGAVPTDPISRAAEGGAPILSAESMYKEAGGACGEGYELVVKKVLGASCECVSESCQNGPGEGREVRTEAERSFGKEKQDDAPVGDSGIKFTFANKD